MPDYALNLTRQELALICNNNPRAIKAFETLLMLSKTIAAAIGFSATSVTTSPYTATFSAGGNYYFCDTSAGNIDFTLPTAVGNLGLASIKKTAAANQLIIHCNGAETIDGAATATILVLDASITVVSDGANWKII